MTTGRRIPRWMFSLYAVVAFVATAVTPLTAAPKNELVEADLQGAWRYKQIVARGAASPVTGIFIFHEGNFLQTAMHDGEPQAKQMALAYAGSYRVDKTTMQLAVDMEIAMDPSAYPASHFREGTSYDCKVQLDGDVLTITFPSDVVQVLERVPVMAPPVVSGRFRMAKRIRSAKPQQPSGYWIFSADRFAYVGAIKDKNGKAVSVMAGEGRFEPANSENFDELVLRFERSFEGLLKPAYGLEQAVNAKITRTEQFTELTFESGDSWQLEFLR